MRAFDNARDQHNCTSPALVQLEVDLGLATRSVIMFLPKHHGKHTADM